MKDFDKERKARQWPAAERTFLLGGETFVAKTGIHPSQFAGYDNIETAEGVKETLAIVDDLILAMIEPDDDSHGRYLQIRANMDDPITVEDLLELVKWLVEIQTGRPTGPPSASAPGQASTGTVSTAASSSLATPKG